MMKRILAIVALSAMSLAVNSVAGSIEDQIVAGGGSDRGAEEVYNAACMACHMTGAAGAPILGDTSAWSARITQSVETLYDHAINGIGAMPAKGGCMSCSDNEVKAVVDFMIEKSS